VVVSDAPVAYLLKRKRWLWPQKNAAVLRGVHLRLAGEYAVAWIQSRLNQPILPRNFQPPTTVAQSGAVLFTTPWREPH
jgi:hypothetical protein